MIVAPNIPLTFRKLLIDNNITFIEGQSVVGNKYPETAKYNIVITPNYLIHKLKITDTEVIKGCTGKQLINVSQAYTRCNLLPLRNDSFITSDMGIYNSLTDRNLNIIYVNREDIILPGFNYGFFGGTCGVYDNIIFIMGSLRKFADGNKVVKFVKALGYEIVELYDGPLLDCGSLFCYKNIELPKIAIAIAANT